MADEEKRSDDDKPTPGDGEEARVEGVKPTEGEARADDDAGDTGGEPSSPPEPGTEPGSEAEEPTASAGDGSGGTSEDVKAASPIETTPGITQDSDSAAAAAEAPHGGEHDEHGLSHTTTLQLLFGVFAALTILTILTVAVTGIDLGSQGNFVVAMIIATVKACLVMAFFMHMIWDSKFNVVVFVSSFLFVLLFLTMSLADRGEYQQTIDSWETANIAEEG